MKRIPFSYSTFATTQRKAYIKAEREKTTVSTEIHKFLLAYTKDEPDPPAMTAESEQPTNIAIATPVNQSENFTGIEPAEALPAGDASNGHETLPAQQASEGATNPRDTTPAVQPEPITATEDGEPGEKVEPGEPGAAAHSDINTGDRKPRTVKKSPTTAQKASPAAKQAKKQGGTAKKNTDKKALKKLTPKPVGAAKKKNQPAKATKSKAKS